MLTEHGNIIADAQGECERGGIRVRWMLFRGLLTDEQMEAICLHLSDAFPWSPLVYFRRRRRKAVFWQRHLLHRAVRVSKQCPVCTSSRLRPIRGTLVECRVCGCVSGAALRSEE